MSETSSFRDIGQKQFFGFRWNQFRAFVRSSNSRNWASASDKNQIFGCYSNLDSVFGDFVCQKSNCHSTCENGTKLNLCLGDVKIPSLYILPVENKSFKKSAIFKSLD